jgi:hypothetical protein
MSVYSNDFLGTGKRWTALALLLLLPAAVVFVGCDQQLEQNPPGQITPGNFFNNEQEFLAAATGVYAQLRNIVFGPRNIEEHPSDEMMVPTRGPDWGDGGIWRQLTQHEWNATHPNLNETWGTMQTGIARANGVLSSLSAASGGISEDQAARFGAEVRFLRAYFYYRLMNAFGGVPIVVEDGNEMYDFPQQPVNSSDPPPHNSRLEVYNFLLQELTGCTTGNFSTDCVNNPDGSSILANLPTDVPYGRANRAAGYALTARLLMNSAVYGVDIGGRGEVSNASELGSGPELYESALAAANTVLNNGNYMLDDYFDNFAYDNSTSSEMIFAATFASGESGLGYIKWNSKLHYNHPVPSGTPWNGFTTIAEFYESYATEPGPDGEMGTQDDVHNDVRGKTFLAGKQYTEPGPGSGCQGDECYSNPNSDPVRVRPSQGEETPPQLELTMNIPKIQLGDVTAEEAEAAGLPSTTDKFILEAPGLRPFKYGHDPNISNTQAGNDAPIFRLAEMYLIRAEALNALDRPGEAVSALNTLRESRAAQGADIRIQGTPSKSELFKLIFRERGHEFIQEALRRQDLIRYQFAHGGEVSDDPYARTFNGPWLFKDQSQPYRALFPIPQTQLGTNPNLQQNPGY